MDISCWQFPATDEFGQGGQEAVFSEKVHHDWDEVAPCDYEKDPSDYTDPPKLSVIYIKFDESKHLRTMLLMTTPSEADGNYEIKVYVGIGDGPDLNDWKNERKDCREAFSDGFDAYLANPSWNINCFEA